MSIEPQGQPISWKAAINEAKIGDSTLKTGELSHLTKTINEFVQSNVFQKYLNDTHQSQTSIKLVLRIENGQLTIKHKDSDTVVILSNQGTSTDADDAKKAVVEKVKNFASYYLTGKNIPHGIANDKGNTCFASSALQLLSHIPSLQSTILSQLPESLSDLKHYSNITKGSQILKSLEKGGKPFPEGLGHDASEVLHFLIDQSPSYPKVKINEHKDLSLDPNHALLSEASSPENKKTIIAVLCSGEGELEDHEDNLGIIELPLSIADEHIDFTETLTNYFNGSNTTKSSTNNSTPFEYTSTSTIRFKEPPKQLFLKLGRREAGSDRNNLPLESTPLILDLKDFMASAVTAQPLHLKGFTAHSGSGTEVGVGGHYIAYFQKTNLESGISEWYCANDDSVTKVSEKEVKEALKQASDLYYDDQVLEPSRQRAVTPAPITSIGSTTPTNEAILSYIENEANFNMSSLSQETTYRAFILDQFRSLPQAAQDSIFATLGAQAINASWITWLTAVANGPGTFREDTGIEEFYKKFMTQEVRNLILAQKRTPLE